MKGEISMKKIFSLILIVALLITGTAFAEFTKMDGDFSIRGGVKFGMTPEEVKSIETNPPASEGEEDKYFYLGYQNIDSLAGIPIYRAKSDIIRYMFSKSENKLYGVRYWFGYYDSTKQYFEELCSTIANKYGQPLHYNDGQTFSRTTSIFSNSMGYVSAGIYRLGYFAEWVVEYSDYYVIIDVYTLNASSEQLNVGYEYISKEEMAQIISDAISDEQEKNEQRNNDV